MAGYSISNDKVENFFEMFHDSGINFSDKEELIALMKITFCTNRNEKENLPKHFSAFFKNSQEIYELKKKQEKLRNSSNNLSDAIEKTKQEYQVRIQKHLDETNLSPLSQKDREALKKASKPFTKKLTDSELNFINDVCKEKMERKKKFSEKNLQALKKHVVKLSEEQLCKGNLENFKDAETMLKILSKKELQKFISGQDITLLHESLEKEIAKLKSSAEKDKKEAERIQKEIDEKMSKDMLKPMAKIHRSDFSGGKNSIRTLIDAPSCVDKKFKQLSDHEKAEVRQYLKNNLLKFKTKMNRNINTLSKIQINMKETIQNTCKTGGLPIDLIFNKPLRRKTDLVLILDVSGSCKEAAEMMISFMWILQDLFPRGCKMFAFTNKLYDISEIMKADDPDAAIQVVLETIPRSGAYSNYYIPLETLWCEKKSAITKDSLVIFMGDARNNKNQSGVEFLKNISRRAKRCYWLNTDAYEKWDQGDSIAATYANYSDMYEVVRVNDMIRFILNIK